MAIGLLVSCGDDKDRAYAESRCASTNDQGSCVLWDASIVELIGRPEAFDKKRVRVIGFVNFEFEGNAIYLSEADFRNAVYRNGLWIDLPKGFESDSGAAAARPNRRYVIAEAVFQAGRGGHFGMWPGTLTDVTRLEPWSRVWPESLEIRDISPPAP